MSETQGGDGLPTGIVSEEPTTASQTTRTTDIQAEVRTTLLTEIARMSGVTPEHANPVYIVDSTIESIHVRLGKELGSNLWGDPTGAILTLVAASTAAEGNQMRDFLRARAGYYESAVKGNVATHDRMGIIGHARNELDQKLMKGDARAILALTFAARTSPEAFDRLLTRTGSRAKIEGETPEARAISAIRVSTNAFNELADGPFGRGNQNAQNVAAILASSMVPPTPSIK